MADASTGVRETQGEPGAESKRVKRTNKKIGICPKNTGANLKGLPNGQS